MNDRVFKFLDNRKQQKVKNFISNQELVHNNYFN